MVQTSQWRERINLGPWRATDKQQNLCWGKGSSSLGMTQRSDLIWRSAYLKTLQDLFLHSKWLVVTAGQVVFQQWTAEHLYTELGLKWAMPSEKCGYRNMAKNYHKLIWGGKKPHTLHSLNPFLTALTWYSFRCYGDCFPAIYTFEEKNQYSLSWNSKCEKYLLNAI